MLWGGDFGAPERDCSLCDRILPLGGHPCVVRPSPVDFWPDKISQVWRDACLTQHNTKVKWKEEIVID